MDKEELRIISGTRSSDGKLIALQIVVIRDIPKIGRVSTTRHLRKSGPDWMGTILDPIPSRAPEFRQYNVTSALSLYRWPG